jgi:hypothetical protein
MNDPVDFGLGTAMRERVADVDPDLDQLLAVSVRAGTRIRRRRGVAVSLAAAVGVAAVAVGAVQIAGGAGTRAVDGGVGFGAEPTDTATSTPTPAAPATAPETPPAGGLFDHAPVTVTAPGWTCEWYQVDDKADCRGPGGKHADLVVRPATDYPAWIADADKGAGDGVATTRPHGPFFISVQGGEGTTDADLERLGKSLRWVD